MSDKKWHTYVKYTFIQIYIDFVEIMIIKRRQTQQRMSQSNIHICIAHYLKDVYLRSFARSNNVFHYFYKLLPEFIKGKRLPLRK